MKTFLGFLTGILSGIILGSVGMAILTITDKDLRNYCDVVAEKLNY